MVAAIVPGAACRGGNHSGNPRVFESNQPLALMQQALAAMIFDYSSETLPDEASRGAAPPWCTLANVRMTSRISLRWGDGQLQKSVEGFALQVTHAFVPAFLLTAQMAKRMVTKPHYWCGSTLSQRASSCNLSCVGIASPLSHFQAACLQMGLPDHRRLNSRSSTAPLGARRCACTAAHGISAFS